MSIKPDVGLCLMLQNEQNWLVTHFYHVESVIHSFKVTENKPKQTQKIMKCKQDSL